jgi:hypothetical protein
VSKLSDLEELIKNLNLPDFTEHTVKSLIKKKDKETKIGKRLNFSGFSCIGIILFMAVYVYLITEGTSNIGRSALSFILSDPILLLIIAALFCTFFYINYYKHKFDKAENDVDKIREDIIDRSTEFWNTPDLMKKRYQLFKFLKDKKDIDLFHK